jgi:hypothetical protein
MKTHSSSPFNPISHLARSNSELDKPIDKPIDVTVCLEDAKAAGHVGSVTEDATSQSRTAMNAAQDRLSATDMVQMHRSG